MSDTLIFIQDWGRNMYPTYEESKNAVTGNHYLGCELIAKCLLSLRTRQTEEDEENDCSREDDRDHGVSKMDVDAQGFIKRQILVHLAVGESSNCVSAHSEGNECHLEEN